MPTPAEPSGEHATTAAAAKDAAARAGTIARMELRLALLELKAKLAQLGLGAGLGAGAATLGLFGLAFLLAAIAAAIATALPVWAALLVMTAATLAAAGALGVLALGSIRRGLPPTPEQAQHEARLTANVLRGNGGRHAG